MGLPAELPDLTPRERAFVDAYVGKIDGVKRFNATAAAIHAGYAAKTARHRGSELRAKRHIMAHVNDVLAAAAAGPNEVLSELADVAFADWREFVEVLERDKDGTPVKVRMDLTNKVKALEHLGKAHGLFVDRIDVQALVAAVELVGVDPDDV